MAIDFPKQNIMNKLILGDNLEILKTFDEESVDLIYLDPPFFSNRNYEVIWGDAGEIRSFQDRWSGGIDHYIAWLKERVEIMHRVLKKTGSFFLHCDWHANAEIKVYILNKIFGDVNMRGEIIWNRSFSHNDAKKKLAVLSDTIWYYSKSNKFIYNPVYSFANKEQYEGRFKYVDENGRYYQSVSMGAPIGGGMSAILPETGKPRGWYIYKGYNPPENGWRYSIETMEEIDRKGEIIYPDNPEGRLRRKKYLDEAKGFLLGNVWTDIVNIQGSSKERIGYPTQKPEALMERIICMASNEGDVVLDPFMGGGTTIAVAERLNRQWIGIDQSVQAVKVTELRLDKQRDLFSVPFSVQLHKYDYDTLRNKDSFKFEQWIIQQFGGVCNAKQRHDFGLDGKMPDGTPIQAKRQDSIGRNVIDNLKSSAERADKRLFHKNIKEKKPVGYVIAFSFGKGAIAEVARLKLEDNIIIELVTVEKIVPIAMKPKVTVEMNVLPATKEPRTKEPGTKEPGTSVPGLKAKGNRKIEFTAHGESEAGVEFYSWDFDYDAEKGFKASVIIDKEGRQSHTFKAGVHTIAVKVVDNEGLESIETVRLKVNGVVEKV